MVMEDGKTVELDVWDTAGQGRCPFVPLAGALGVGGGTRVCGAERAARRLLGALAGTLWSRVLVDSRVCMSVYVRAEVYRTILPLYYKAAAIVLLCFDITNKVPICVSLARSVMLE